jgi:hypothetical protein
MKNIGLITFYRPINHGAVLQALSLQKVLNGMGYQAELIDYRFPRIERYRRIFRPEEYRALLSHPKKVLRRVCADALYGPARIAQRRAFERFTHSWLRLSERMYTTKDALAEYCQQYDIYVVGSDLVWNPEMTEGLDSVCFLDFVQDKVNKRLISYASSIGTEQVGEQYLPLYRKMLKNFDAISVREASAVRILQPLTSTPVTHVLDPSLLTTAEDWYEMIPPIPKQNKYVLSMMLEYSPLLIRTVAELADKENLEIVHLDLKNYYGNRKTTSVYSAGPDEFLMWISGAEHVVTNSFHGCAFALIFHRELWCIPHTLRGVRMTELLNSLGLSERIVTDEKAAIHSETIDYQAVEKRLRGRRDTSMQYLYRALEGA